MSVAKAVASIVVGTLLLAVAFSLALIPMGKPTPWQLIGAPQVVNSENLLRPTGEPDYPWTVHLRDVQVGLLPCEGFASPAPKAGDQGVFCSTTEGVELEHTADGSILRIEGISYRYNCVAGPRLSETVDPLFTCSVDPLASIFG